MYSTPAMGWNSWNTFGSNINEKLIMEMTDRIVAEGYKEAGYEYVIIDDCWSLKERATIQMVYMNFLQQKIVTLIYMVLTYQKLLLNTLQRSVGT